MRNRLNIYLSPELLRQIADLASRKKLSRSAIIQAAVTSFLSPDGADRREAAFTRRLDLLTADPAARTQRWRYDGDVGDVRALLVDHHTAAAARRRLDMSPETAPRAR